MPDVKHDPNGHRESSNFYSGGRKGRIKRILNLELETPQVVDEKRQLCRKRSTGRRMKS